MRKFTFYLWISGILRLGDIISIKRGKKFFTGTNALEIPKSKTGRLSIITCLF